MFLRFQVLCNLNLEFAPFMEREKIEKNKVIIFNFGLKNMLHFIVQKHECIKRLRRRVMPLTTCMYCYIIFHLWFKFVFNYCSIRNKYHQHAMPHISCEYGCGATFTSTAAYSAHVDSTHNKMVCNTCGEICFGTEEFLAHFQHATHRKNKRTRIACIC